LRAYERVARLAAPLVAPGGYLVLCSCTHAADIMAAFAMPLRAGLGAAGGAGNCCTRALQGQITPCCHNWPKARI